MSQGYSFESFAAEIDCHRDTLYEWVKVHPEFSDSKKRATAKCQKFWEKLAIDNIIGNKDANLNPAVWIFNMRNRFGWRDDPKDNNGSAPIKIELVKASNAS